MNFYVFVVGLFYIVHLTAPDVAGENWKSLQSLKNFIDSSTVLFSTSVLDDKHFY